MRVGFNRSELKHSRHIEKQNGDSRQDSMVVVAFRFVHRSRKREVFYPMYKHILSPFQSGHECTLGDLGFLILKEM